MPSGSSTVSVVTTVVDKTVANTTRGTIVRDTQACETAASLHSTLRKREREKKKPQTCTPALVGSLTPLWYKQDGTRKCVGKLKADLSSSHRKCY